MRQVLFWIPLNSLSDWLPDIPIYGYGAMLFLAFVLCTWLARKLGEREGYPRERIQDMAIWMFVTGILGARVTFMIQAMIEEPERYPNPFLQFFAIWDGGLVFYGSFIGGTVGLLLAYAIFLRKAGVQFWKLIDIIAPCLALGLCLGRIGCLLNGCCYGNVDVDCPDCALQTFPFSSPPRSTFTERGLQTPAGFTMLGGGSRLVGAVQPHSPAAEAGLRPRDEIQQIEGKEVESYADIVLALGKDWKRGKNGLSLTVKHTDGQEETLPTFYPRTIPLHLTQVYESVSTALLLFLLLAYYPLRSHDGSLMVLFMAAYAVHRFLNEMLRTDNEPVWMDMTLSQNISLLLMLAAAILAILIWRRPTDAVPRPV